MTKKELDVSGLSEKSGVQKPCRKPQAVPAEHVIIPSHHGSQESEHYSTAKHVLQ